MAILKIYNGLAEKTNDTTSAKILERYAKVFCDGAGDHLFYFVGCGCCYTPKWFYAVEKEVIENGFKKVTVIYRNKIYEDITERKVFINFIKGIGIEYNEIRFDPIERESNAEKSFSTPGS